MKILLVGIGQVLRGDDAVGLEVVKAWSTVHKEHASDVDVILCETPAMELLDISPEEYSTIILVDAVQSHGMPGEITFLEGNQLNGSPEIAASSHGWGVLEILKLKEVMNNSPLPPFYFIGISGNRFNYETSLSPLVEKAVSKAVEILEQSIQAQLNKKIAD